MVIIIVFVNLKKNSFEIYFLDEIRQNEQKFKNENDNLHGKKSKYVKLNYFSLLTLFYMLAEIDYIKNIQIEEKANYSGKFCSFVN